MRALQIIEPGRTQMIDVPVPDPVPGEVLLRIEAVTTCPQWDQEVLKIPADLPRDRVTSLELAMCMQVSFDSLERLDCLRQKRFGVVALARPGSSPSRWQGLRAPERSLDTTSLPAGAISHCRRGRTRSSTRARSHPCRPGTKLVLSMRRSTVSAAAHQFSS